jgi:hypothetical protein
MDSSEMGPIEISVPLPVLAAKLVSFGALVFSNTQLGEFPYEDGCLMLQTDSVTLIP